ncbi:MAG: 50S ribosomal protein L11 methyltransferase [Eubacterium sp.]|jgi:ribosomal protein L11 methyltransferase|nr:50S ribosomal protein L11 methyltransferase [Eubacterium sp.]
MIFLKIDIFTRSEGIYPICAMLQDIGIEGFDIHDSSDFEDFVQNYKGYFDYIDESLEVLRSSPTYLTVYLADDEQGHAKLLEICKLLKRLSINKETFGELRLEKSTVKEEDWENNWKEYYKPFNIGEKLIIKPSWEEINDPNGRLALEIDPAGAFGTGQHASTKLCLEALEKTIKTDFRMLDIGTGSGILAIAGLLFGAKNVSIVDISENSVRTALENITRNNFDKSRYSSFCGDICTDKKLVSQIGKNYDVVVANIVANVIIAMSDIFGGFLAPGGTLIVSGIIDERADEVLSFLNKVGFRIITQLREDGWNAICLNRIK